MCTRRCTCTVKFQDFDGNLAIKEARFNLGNLIVSPIILFADLLRYSDSFLLRNSLVQRREIGSINNAGPIMMNSCV